MVLALVAATLGGLAIAATTKVGPVVVSLSARHGIHLGDLLGFALCYTAVFLADRRWPPRR